MKQLFFLISVFTAISVSSQDTVKLKYLKIISDYTGHLFYTNDKIKEITFCIVAPDMLEGMNFNLLLEKQSFTKSSNESATGSDTILCKIKLKHHPSASEIRALLEKTNLSTLYINNQRLWVNTLLTKEEAFQKYLKMDLKEMPFKAEYNNPETPEYYEYKSMYLNSKMRYMMGGNYPEYIYNGSVTKFQDELETLRKDKEDFEQQYGNGND